MPAEKVNLRPTPTSRGTVNVIIAANARQTRVPASVPNTAKATAGMTAAGVPAVLAANARQTHTQTIN